jgi:glutamine synthetase
MVKEFTKFKKQPFQNAYNKSEQELITTNKTADLYIVNTSNTYTARPAKETNLNLIVIKEIVNEQKKIVKFCDRSSLQYLRLLHCTVA